MQGNKAVRLYWKEAESCRVEKQNEINKIMNLYYSHYFAHGVAPTSPTHYRKIPLHRCYEHDAFMSEVAKYNYTDFALWTRGMDIKPCIYPRPRFQSLLNGDENWLNTENRIMTAANDLSAQYAALQYLIYVSDDYYAMNYENWTTLTDVQKEKIRDDFSTEIDKLLSMQGGRMIINTDARDLSTGLMSKSIEIIDLQDKVNRGKWLPDDSAVTLKILSVLGAPYGQIETASKSGQSLGAGSGSNVKAGYNIGIHGNTIHQNYITRDHNIIARINEWKGRYFFVNKALVDDNQTKTGIGTDSKMPNKITQSQN
jgi:hypothetical protein